MRKLLTFLLFALPCFGAAPAIVQTIAKTPGSVATTTIAFTTNNTLGNTILACVAGSGATTISLPSDTQTNTYTLQSGTNGKDASNGNVECGTAINIKAGANTVTLGEAAAHTILCFIMEISGVPTSGVIDQTGLANDVAITTGVATSGATTNATELVIAFWENHAANTTTWAATTGYTAVTLAGGVSTCTGCINDATNSESAFVESLATSSTGTQTSKPSAGPATSVLQAGIITFIPSGGAAAPSGFNKRQKIEQMERGL